MKNTLITIACLLLALALSFFIYYGLNSPFVPMVMLLPVFVVTALFGQRYGYPTAFVSLVVIYFFFCDPVNTFAIKDSSAFVRVVTYILLSVISIIFIAQKQASDEALRDAVVELASKREIERLLDIARDSEDEIQALNEELEASLKTVEIERRHLQEILNEMSSMVIIKDEKFKYTFVNNALCEFLGKPCDELFGKTIFDFLPPDEAQKIWANEKALLDNNTVQTIEESATDARGVQRTLLSVKKPMMADDGKMGILVVITDITERKAMEMELKESERMYRSLFENMLNGFAYCRMLFDDNGKPDDFIYISVNASFGRQTGLKDVIGRKVSEVIPRIKETDRELIELYGRVSITGVSEHFETYVSALDSWFSISVYAPQYGYFVAVFDVITERKIAEAAMRESEGKFRSIFENSHDALMLSDENGWFDCNQRTVELFGMDNKDDVMKYHPADLSPSVQDDGEDSHIAANRWIDTAFKEDSCHFEWLHKRKNGEVFPADVLLTAFDYHGKRVIQATVRDITELKRSKEEIALKNRHLQAVMDGVPNLIFIKDEHHRWVFVNKAFCNFFCRDKDALLGNSDYSFMPTEQAERIWADDDEVLRYEKTLIGEEKLIGCGGIKRVFIVHKKPFLLDNGQVGLLGIATDITERQEARRTSAMLRRFFDNTAEGMIITDKDGVIKAVNLAFTKMSGYEADEAIGKTPRILRSGQHGKEFYEKMWEEMAQNGRWEGEVINKRKNGETYPEWLTITKILDDNKNVENYIAIMIDMTQIYQDRQKIADQDRMILAQSRYAAMGEMISMIAHQWRQPITAIGMSTNNMLVDIELGEIKQEAFEKHLESINAQVHFLSQTIDDFRNFFRSNNERSIVHVGKPIEGALKIVSKSLENNNIAIELDKACTVSEDEDGCFGVEIHESEFVQVLLVLFGNAKDVLLEKNVQNPKITVKCSADQKQGTASVSICDNGGGVPEDIADKIFEPYFTTKSSKNGTGLGLYIAKVIVGNHKGGALSLENRDGGACFTIQLPLRKVSDSNEK